MLRASRILFKATGAKTSFGLMSMGARVTVKTEELFSSIRNIDQTTDERAISKGEAAQWYIAEFDAGFRDAWQVCHDMIQAGHGIVGGRVLYAEPDFEQPSIWTEHPNSGFSFREGEDPPKPQESNPYQSVPGHEFWHLDTDYSQLLKARNRVFPKRAQAGLRIAHLDTGYDPGHESLPKLTDKTLHQNFYDPGDDPTDATDRKNGLAPDNFGHGTGTLATLAGQDMPILGEKRQISGGANFEILPIRVAASVVLFRNSSIARAFDYVHGLADNPATRCDVVTLSMGGLACQAWADAINALYEKGIVVVAAAGNNFSNLPTRNMVYPARFNRVIAACGVMAGGKPYADLPRNKMQGNYGPKGRMGDAMAAYTPNVPWARYGSRDIFDFNGGGTSQATPQIASAAALWLQAHMKDLPAPTGRTAWRRAEMARQALYRSAQPPASAEDRKRLGHGTLRAYDALLIKPAELGGSLNQAKKDDVSFPFIKILTGLGVTSEPTAAQRMLELEALQLSQLSPHIELALDDVTPDALSSRDMPVIHQALEDLRRDGRASATLKSVLSRVLGHGAEGSPPSIASALADGKTMAATTLSAAGGVPGNMLRRAHIPSARRLKIFATDPLAATLDDQFHLNTVTIDVPWEADLQPGPRGEYLEVIDVDPASNAAYLPVDLNAPGIIATDGLSPAEGDPQFHQQMVYAVGMRTIKLFELALGRCAQWSEQGAPEAGRGYVQKFVRRLRVYPHALREANAYYSPNKKALLFGYFNAGEEDVGDNLPGGLIFTCLSHDIVAHEVSHALLDGLHPRFSEPSNGDMWAFHEAFSDIVALFQHFTIPHSLRYEIGRNRGDVGVSAVLSGLAHQFGQAIQKRGALRSAIATETEPGVWQRIPPSKNDYKKYGDDNPHMKGSILVAAVFDAFLRIYQRETRDLIALSTGGAGILPPGNLQPLLAEKLAEKAALISGRVLNIVIRALDYCPPVALTFGEFLRAIITADRELVPDDQRGYRVAFISAFRDRGIFPQGVRNLSEDSLSWYGPEHDLSQLNEILAKLDVDWDLKSDRFQAYLSSNENARRLARSLQSASEETLFELGLAPTSNDIMIDGRSGKTSPIEVHSVRPSVRVGPDGSILRETIIELTQKWRPKGDLDGAYRGGCTLIFDPEAQKIKYIIRKRVGHAGRVREEQALRPSMLKSIHGSAYSSGKRGHEPFALLHRH